MLHIWLPTQYSELYVWLDKQQLWQVHESWQSISEHFSERTACLYFPSKNILQIESTLSAGQLKQLGESGKQYLFEELSLTPVEQLRIREYSQDGHQYLYACSTSEIEQWKNSASLVDIDIECMFPDFLLLPAPDTSYNNKVSNKTSKNTSNTDRANSTETNRHKKVTLYSDKQTTLLRYSQANGMAVSFLPLILESLQLVDEVVLVPAVNDSEQDEALLKFLESLTQPYSLSSLGLRPIDKIYRQPLNFMVTVNKSILSPYLKTTLIVAVLALASQMIADGISIYQYDKTIKATQTTINNQYKAWFPDNRLNTRTNLQAQLEPMLKSGASTENTGLSLLSRVSPLIKQSNLTANSLLADDTSLKVKLIAKNRSQLDQFVQKLQQQGMSAKLGQVNSRTQTAQQAGQQLIGEVVINHKSS